MNDGMRRQAWLGVWGAVLFLVLSACQGGRAAGTVQPTAPSPGTPTLWATVRPSQMATPFVSDAPARETPTPCYDAAAPGIPLDLTIPDDTVVRPGEVFTKMWRVVNTGTCTWTSAYALVWFAGPSLGAPQTVPLRGKVPPGHAAILAVDMVAPLADGVYQSYWKLRSPTGRFFGIGGGAGEPFWVRIRVASGHTPTPTATPTLTPPPTATPTPRPSPTPTPLIQTSGRVALTLGDGLEVDGRKASATDLLYLSVGGAHILRPQDAARWGVFGTQRPSLRDCLSSVRSVADLPVDSLPDGTYLCYRSSDGRFGYARLELVNRQTWRVVISFVTWISP